MVDLPNLTQAGYQCNEIITVVDYNPLLMYMLFLYFVVIMSFIVFFDFELKKRWRKNDEKNKLSSVSELSNGHGQ